VYVTDHYCSSPSLPCSSSRTGEVRGSIPLRSTGYFSRSRPFLAFIPTTTSSSKVRFWSACDLMAEDLWRSKAATNSSSRSGKRCP
jgi:hypothetical protein